MYIEQTIEHLLARVTRLEQDLAQLRDNLGAGPYDPEKEMRRRMEAVRGYHISQLEFSVRTANVLDRLGVQTVGDLMDRSAGALRAERNFGIRSFNEVRDALDNLGVRMKP